MQSPGAGRILFDISTSMRAVGPPTGIVRVERKLASWAYANVKNIEYVFFDPNRQAYSALACDARQFLAGDAAIDDLEMTNPARPGGRRTDRIPARLRGSFLWITQTRRMALNRLERIRLRIKGTKLTALIDRVQRGLMSPRHRRIMVRHDGARRPFFPHDVVLGPPIAFSRRDTLICVGCGWAHTNIAAIRDLKSRTGFRMVLLCHDLIPVQFPRFYRQRDVQTFTEYLSQALAIADLVVVTSRSVEADCRNYCAERGIIIPKMTIAPLGYDVAESDIDAQLPEALRTGHFALLVSTIEPRKGHGLLYKVWRRLLAEGIPQAFDFKLVFAGRAGWMVDQLLDQLRKDPQVAGQILVLHDVDDSLLAALYRNAAFCVYPSVYEGYGLPLVEAFSYGKAVLTSNGGALAELAQGFSPCLDPLDEQAWYEVLKQWIEMPEARAAHEQEIRSKYHHPTWSEAAESFFRAIAQSASGADLLQ